MEEVPNTPEEDQEALDATADVRHGSPYEDLIGQVEPGFRAKLLAMDPEDRPDFLSPCRAMSESFACTRKKGHAGNHVSVASTGKVVFRWT